MHAKSHTTNINRDPMARAKRNMSKARVSYALNGDSRDNAQDGEDDEGEQIADEDDAEEEGGCRHGHCGSAVLGGGARRGLACAISAIGAGAVVICLLLAPRSCYRSCRSIEEIWEVPSVVWKSNAVR